MMVGLTSGVFQPGCPTAICSCSGSSYFATRADVGIHSFIEHTMQRWDGNLFQCHLAFSVDNLPYMECWGAPCMDSSVLSDGPGVCRCESPSLPNAFQGSVLQCRPRSDQGDDAGD